MTLFFFFITCREWPLCFLKGSRGCLISSRDLEMCYTRRWVHSSRSGASHGCKSLLAVLIVVNGVEQPVYAVLNARACVETYAQQRALWRERKPTHARTNERKKEKKNAQLSPHISSTLSDVGLERVPRPVFDVVEPHSPYSIVLVHSSTKTHLGEKEQNRQSACGNALEEVFDFILLLRAEKERERVCVCVCVRAWSRHTSCRQTETENKRKQRARALRTLTTQ